MKIILLLLGVLTCLPNLSIGQNKTGDNQLVCKAPQNDVIPCEASSPFTPVTEPEPDSGISNPVNVVTGEKFLKEIDLPESVTGQFPPLIRFYRSGAKHNGYFGVGWLSIYDIQAKYQGNNLWLIKFANGSQYELHAAKDRAITWYGSDKRQLSFNSKGQLILIKDQKFGAIKILYHQRGTHKSLIKQVIQAKNKLNFNYYKADGLHQLVSSIDSPLGRFNYQYDQNMRLVQVSRPDGMFRSYHYEPKLQQGNYRLITGVSITDGHTGASWRARTWLYDNNARVIQAYPNNRPEHKLTFSYGGKSNRKMTTLMSRLGTSKIYYKHIKGRAKIVRISTTINGVRHKLNTLYDSNGQLAKIADTSINRHENGVIKTLAINDSTWPELRLEYAKDGKLLNWYSAISGLTSYKYQTNGLLERINHADNYNTQIVSDFAGRPIKIQYSGPGKKPININISWHGTRIRSLHHPNEDEYLEFNSSGQLTKRTIRRKSRQALTYREEFSYYSDGRLKQHRLPEQGSLIYHWQGNKITGLEWLDKNQHRHYVLKPSNTVGYVYGNDLATQMLHNNRQSTLLLSNNKNNDIIWGEHRLNDTAGRLKQHLIMGSKASKAVRSYAYNKLNQTIATNTRRITDKVNELSTRFMHWQADGSLAQQNTSLQTPAINRDTSGIPTSIGKYGLIYQSQQRLAAVKVAGDDKSIANYHYNARGHRIVQNYGENSAHRLYVDNKLVAVWSFKNENLVARQRYIYANKIAIGLIATDNHGNDKLYFIHNNQLGAPVLVTDNNQQIVWQASYDSLGKAKISIEKIKMPLRLPGQDEDPVTGWHDNIFRTYLPEQGQYLEPDPLGPVPGQQAFGYARQQPQSLTDPLGLILLAFDGTNNSSPNQSNVWKLSQAYIGPSYYHQGPGNSFESTWDAITAASSKQIQANQWQSLLDGIQIAKNQQQAKVTVDLLGYSRGAALARDFANQIAANTNNNWFSYNDPIRGNISICIDLRFIGLFDTVAQFGLLNSANANFNLRINDAWLWVAHAVAANEHRALFPVVSATAENNANAIEIPFIGAHADIGGGMLLDDGLQPGGHGDLSDVALNWMFWQAKAALLPLQELQLTDKTVTNPLLHDERTIISDAIFQEDRFVQDSQTNIISLQDDHPGLGRQQRSLFENFINRVGTNGNIAGEVDMRAYNTWLEENYGMPAVYN